MIYLNAMKTDIHPQYFPEAQVVCVCGNRFTVGSTVEKIHVELCNKCHPFYTGQQKFVDTVGRIEKFKQKQEKARLRVASAKQAKVEKEREEQQPRTLKEMLTGLK